jgi:hypothetical protein
MLAITVGATDVYDESTEKFGADGGFELQLEHSLVSLSKWESKFEKPFLGKDSKSPEEILEYVRCMVLTPNPPGDFLQKLSKENLEDINAYIERKMTATWFSELQPETRSRSETITSELIYYWMTAFNIPFECETWHLNRLFTLIRIANIKQSKPKKMSRSEIAARNREMNRRRREQFGTKG